MVWFINWIYQNENIETGLDVLSSKHEFIEWSKIVIFYWFRLLSTRPIFANQAQYFWYSSSLTNHSFRSNCSSLISGISFTSETVQKSQKLKSGSCVSLQTLSQRNTLKHLLWKKTQLDPSVLVHPLNCNKKIQVQGKYPWNVLSRYIDVVLNRTG